MEEILEMITLYGFETVIIALMVNLFTGLTKIPIKVLANKLNDYTKVTRFIVFLPILLGFLISIIYVELIQRATLFDKDFFTLWLTSSSLSLTFYAIFEKLLPSKKKITNDVEIKTSQAILEKIKSLVETNILKVDSAVNEMEESGGVNIEKNGIENKKIVLKGKSNGYVETKEK